jgi:hypothetical protein
MVAVLAAAVDHPASGVRIIEPLEIRMVSR